VSGHIILFIGSDAAEQQTLERILSVHYSFFSAQTVTDAIRLSLQKTPDLILLSQTADGRTLTDNAAMMQTHKRLRTVSVIAIVPIGTADNVTLDNQIVDTLNKPFVDVAIPQRLRVHLNIANRNREMQEQLDLLQTGLISSISEMVECRDENTGGHIARTSRYVMLLGMELLESGVFGSELTEEDIQLIGRAAPLHDIGKVGVSDVILLKPGKLTDDEFAAMKRHAAVGKVMLERLSANIPSQRYLAYASVIAGTHHEKFDGSGYPSGAKGTDIPLSGRIMAVADVYDALVADRIYRKAMSQEKAYAIITESSGTHFDPRIVKAFENVFEMMSAIATAANEKMAAAHPVINQDYDDRQTGQ
jgi:putative two-component system response regulator